MPLSRKTTGMMLCALLISCTQSEFGSTGAVTNLFGHIGQGGVENVTRSIGAFQEVRVSNGIDVFWETPPEDAEGNTLKMAFNRTLTDLIFQEIIKGILVLRTSDRQNIASADEKTITLQVPLPTQWRVSDRSRVSLPDLKAQTLTIECNGDAELTLSGELEKLTVTGFDNCEILAPNLKVAQADITLNQSATAELQATQTLKVDLNQNSRVTYSGEAQVEKNLSGSAQLVKTEAPSEETSRTSE